MADFEFSDDNNLVVEIIEVNQEDEGGWTTVDIGDNVRGTLEKINKAATQSAFQTIYTLARRTSHLIRSLEKSDPDTPIGEVQLQFGLVFTSETQVAIIKGTGEANINVTISWKKSNG